MSKQAVTAVDRVGFHAEQIGAALIRAQEARFEVIARINAAYSELGEDVFQKELAVRLGMSAPQLTRYVKIGQCNPLLDRSDKVTETLTTLYELTRLQTEMVKAYGEKPGSRRFEEFLDKHVNPTTEAKKISDAIAKVKAVSSKAKRAQREEDLLTLNDNSLPKRSLATVKPLSFSQLLEKKSVFKTIFIDIGDEALRWSARQGVFAMDVAEKYPIADLRSPSVAETVMGFVLCRADLIDGGIKLLEASGFEYRDLFSPSSGSSGYELLREHEVVLRGERGTKKSFRQDFNTDASTDGALSIAEALGKEPRLLISKDVTREGWTCLDPTLA